MKTNNLSIGKLAETANVGIETVRFYQRKGLLREPDRPYGGIRRYTDDDVKCIRFIKAAQTLGFKLSEISELLDLETGGTCAEVQALAREKQQVVRKRLADLKRLDKTLTALLQQCKTTRGRVGCPIITALENS